MKHLQRAPAATPNISTDLDALKIL